MSEFASPDGLRKWLESKKPRHIVGLVCKPRGCPAVNYLISIGLEDVCVMGVGYSFLRGGRYERDIAPDWLREFVHGIDRHNDMGKSVQARTALRILNEVMK